MRILKSISMDCAKYVIVTIMCFFSFDAISSVTMIGSRIIYPESSQSVDVEFKNPDKIPYAVQAWFDSGDDHSTPATGKAPFIANPVLFRLTPGNGQVMRISYTGSRNIPQDRESVFYFNFLQIPPVNAIGNNGKKNNKMIIVLKNRVKVFFRPRGIPQTAQSLLDLITVKSYPVNNGLRVDVNNKSPYYVSLTNVKIRQGNKTYKEKAEMMSPFSSTSVSFKNINAVKNSVIEIEYINDQGARIKKEYAGA